MNLHTWRQHGLAVLMLVAAGITTGCGGAADTAGLASLQDDAGLLAPKAEATLRARLEKLAGDRDLIVVVRTSKSPSGAQELWAALDDGFEDEAFWQDPRVQARRTWADSFGRVFGRTAPAKSVHVSVFSTPPFIGVRYGADARLRALFSDILIGPPMQAIQQRAAAGQATRALYELVALMEQRFKSPKGLTWVETFASLGAPEILSETVDTLTTADWELYNRWLLRPALALQARLADVVSGGVVPIVLLIVATLLLKLLKAVVRALTSLLERQWAAGVRVASNVAIEWLIALPTIGSMLLLAHGRLEDRLFVAALLGRSSVDVAPLFETGLGVRTHFLIAVAVAAIVIGGRLLDHLYLMVLGDFPDKVQREMFAQRTHVEQFFLSLPSSDTVDFDAERPYTSAFFGLCWAWLKELGAWTLVLWVLPLSVTVYIGARALVASLIDLRGNLKLRAQLRETLATYQTAA